MTPKVFLITGTSTGFGFELVRICLARGDHVVATARNSSALKGSFPESKEDNLLLVDLDVTKVPSIDKAFEAALKKFGRVDVVVNNAGYGLSGEFESLADEQIRKQMEVNFFGVVNVTRKALAVMREQKPSGGVIQQVTSIGGKSYWNILLVVANLPGKIGSPTLSSCRWIVTKTIQCWFWVDCASKWAVEGFTESVSNELNPEWGIHFTLIEPGGFRTDWAGRSMEFAANKNPAYNHIDTKAFMSKRNGTQAGDPKKGAQVFYDLAVMEDPPLRCIVGTDAFAIMNQVIQKYSGNLKKYEKLSNSTDAEGYEAPAQIIPSLK
jgi:NAD(P)-dependent dehydrogenase (short-subunit alcohol dehydrogenase family)